MNLLKKYLKENSIALIFSIAIFIWVLYVSKSTTLAGDDWAFHNNTMKDGILDSAIGMYYGWEGRLMTLFSIHTLILHKSIWEIVNALIYVVIFLVSYALVQPNKKILYGLVFLVLLLTMKENIRMEVVTWITGSVYYGIPLMLSFVYLGLNYSFYNLKTKKVPILLVIISMLCAFYLPLGMENIAIASMIGSIVLLVAYYLRDKKVNRVMVLNLIAMSIAYMIWFNSPGSSIRLDRMPDWQALSFFGKLAQTIPNVLYFTFYQNRVLISMLSLVLIVFNLQQNKNRFQLWFIPVYGLSIVILFSQRILLSLPTLSFLGILSDGYSMFNIVFWIIYAIVLVLNIVVIDIQHNEFKLSYFLIVAVFASAALLMSPVIGYRLMVYTFFYLSLVIYMIIDRLRVNQKFVYIVIIGLFVLAGMSARNLINKFGIVKQITNEREAILADYQLYSDLYKDGIWLPRYPIYSLHAGDIEFEDTYHMEAFKIYHDIDLDERITFYWKDSY